LILKRRLHAGIRRCRRAGLFPMEDAMTIDDKSQREIRKIAYGLWMQDGQPEGRDREHWEAAKEIWAFNSHDHALSDDNADSTQQAAISGDRDRGMG
jgi:hypothetical protein